MSCQPSGLLESTNTLPHGSWVGSHSAAIFLGSYSLSLGARIKATFLDPLDPGPHVLGDPPAWASLMAPETSASADVLLVWCVEYHFLGGGKSNLSTGLYFRIFLECGENLCFYHGNVQQKSVWLQLRGGLCAEDPNGYLMGCLTLLHT